MKKDRNLLIKNGILKMMKHYVAEVEDVIAEDYNLSRKVPSRQFILSNKTILTDGRRFRNKGVWYMLKLMIKT